MRFVPALVSLIGLGLAAAGCSKPAERLNAPPQGSSHYPSEMQAHFVYMTDNAMLEDLSLADIHFVPHSAELNGLGVRRLERYAKLLTVYGGSIRYSTNLTDDPLVERRMAGVRKYLATTGIEGGRLKVARDLPGGKGMAAREAITAKATNIPGVPTDQKAAARGLMGALGGLFGGGK